MRHALSLLFVVVYLLPSSLQAANEAAALRAALNSIRSDDLKAHVNVLAADSFEGREAGSRGGRAAAGYLSSKLQQLGLSGGTSNGSFYQTFSGRYRNILAKIPGSDPQLAKEWIVIGAHYDHVGYGSPRNSYGPTGYIHNGADDNASGTAAMLEIAEALINMPTRPKRTVLFIFFDGEEKGLLGSKHWVASPTVPLSQVKAMINMDMVGRLRRERVEVYGARTAAGLRELISRQNRDLALRLDFQWTIKPNSDHHSFFRHSIPIVMFHTGLHDNYHRPSDDAHLVNTEGMQRVSRLVFLTAHALATRESLSGFRTASRQENSYDRRRLEQPYAKRKPRLGIAWKLFDEEEGTLTVSLISRNSPAAKAGLQRGDRLQLLNGQPIESPAAFRQSVLAAPNESLITVLRDGESEPVELPVVLPGAPVRIGFSWRNDTAEPGTALVASVIPGSAAETARLRLKDRVYEVNGRTFQSTAQLKQLLSELPGPIELLVERQGRLRIVSVDVE